MGKRPVLNGNRPSRKGIEAKTNRQLKEQNNEDKTNIQSNESREIFWNEAGQHAPRKWKWQQEKSNTAGIENSKFGTREPAKFRTIVIALSWFRKGTCIHTQKMEETDSKEAHELHEEEQINTVAMQFKCNVPRVTAEDSEQPTRG